MQGNQQYCWREREHAITNLPHIFWYFTKLPTYWANIKQLWMILWVMSFLKTPKSFYWDYYLEMWLKRGPIPFRILIKWLKCGPSKWDQWFQVMEEMDYMEKKDFFSMNRRKFIFKTWTK